MYCHRGEEMLFDAACPNKTNKTLLCLLKNFNNLTIKYILIHEIYVNFYL